MMIRFLVFIVALCLSTLSFGQIEFGSDTTDIFGEDTAAVEGVREIVKREGGSANRGTVYFFYEKPLNVGLPNLQFIDTIRHLFHRYDPLMRDNIFRTNRGNVGLVTEDLEYSYQDNLLFSYGKSPFELYRYTPFNTKFHQNVDPYVELNYVLGGEREQNFRMLFTQNVYRGLNVGAEYNAILSPGVYARSFTRHNNIRVFSNFISKNQHYRAVAGYYFNKFEANENGGIAIHHDSLQFIADVSNKRTIPIHIEQAENFWRENTFYLKQSYHLGINRKERTNVDIHENESENDSIPNTNLNVREKIPRNFGYISHTFEMTRFSTIFSDKRLSVENYPTAIIPRDTIQTFDSTYIELIRNTVSYNIGDVTSYETSQFLNLSFGATIDLAKVRTGEILDTNKADPIGYYEDFQRDFNYLYPFARLRLNYDSRYFLSAGATYQMDLFYPHQNPNTFSANARLDYFFDREKSNNGAFFEANYSEVLPRPFQEFYVGNSFKWDTSFNNVKTLNLAVGARCKGFTLKFEHTTFDNYIYLTPTHFEQSDKSFSVFKASLEKTFRFWKILAFDTRLVYQQNTSETIMRLPEFSTRSALYFDFVLLGATPVQIGFEAYYNTPFHSRLYNPALGMFYDQQKANDGKLIETGGFVFADAFLNLRIKRANLCFKYNNIGANLWGYNYVITKGCPVPYRMFTFGVLWRFYD